MSTAFSSVLATRYLQTLMSSPALSLLLSGCRVPAFCAFPPLKNALVPKSYWPFAGLTPVGPCLWWFGSPGVNTALQVWPHQCRVERSLLFTKTLRCFFAKLLSCLSGHSLYLVPGVFPLRQQDLAFPLTELCENRLCPEKCQCRGTLLVAGSDWTLCHWSVFWAESFSQLLIIYLTRTPSACLWHFPRHFDLLGGKNK